MYSIQTKWEVFEAACLKGVTPQQHREAKVAFYAGVVSMLKAQDEAAQSCPDKEEKTKIISDWMSELDVFQKTYLCSPVARH
jgi:hypothetical protein